MLKERPHFSQRRCISSPALAYSHESCQHETSFSTISQLSLPRELSFFPEITAPATAAAPDRTCKTSAFWDPRNCPCQSVHPHKKEKVYIKLTGWLVTVFKGKCKQLCVFKSKGLFLFSSVSREWGKKEIKDRAAYYLQRCVPVKGTWHL